MIDYRRFKRISAEFISALAPKVHFPEDERTYSVLNFSFQGFFIADKTSTSKGNVLEVQMEIPAIGKIPMIVAVVHVQKEGQEGIGVEILSIPEEYRKIWTNFIKACHLLLEAMEYYLDLRKDKNAHL